MSITITRSTCNVTLYLNEASIEPDEDRPENYNTRGRLDMVKHRHIDARGLLNRDQLNRLGGSSLDKRIQLADCSARM